MYGIVRCCKSRHSGAALPAPSSPAASPATPVASPAPAASSAASPAVGAVGAPRLACERAQRWVHSSVSPVASSSRPVLNAWLGLGLGFGSGLGLVLNACGRYGLGFGSGFTAGIGVEV